MDTDQVAAEDSNPLGLDNHSVASSLGKRSLGGDSRNSFISASEQELAELTKDLSADEAEPAALDAGVEGTVTPIAQIGRSSQLSTENKQPTQASKLSNHSPHQDATPRRASSQQHPEQVVDGRGGGSQLSRHSAAPPGSTLPHHLDETRDSHNNSQLSHHSNDPRGGTPLSHHSEPQRDPRGSNLSHHSGLQRDPRGSNLSHHSELQRADPRGSNLSHHSELHRDDPRGSNLSHHSELQRNPKGSAMSHPLDLDDHRASQLSHHSEGKSKFSQLSHHSNEPRESQLSHHSNPREQLSQLSHHSHPVDATRDSPWSHHSDKPDPRVSQLSSHHSEPYEPRTSQLSHHSQLKEPPLYDPTLPRYEDYKQRDSRLSQNSQHSDHTPRASQLSHVNDIAPGFESRLSSSLSMRQGNEPRTSDIQDNRPTDVYDNNRDSRQSQHSQAGSDSRNSKLSIPSDRRLSQEPPRSSQPSAASDRSQPAATTSAQSNNNTRRSYDLQQALRLDDLEVKIGDLKKQLAEREVQNRQQQEKIRQLENDLITEKQRTTPSRLRDVDDNGKQLPQHAENIAELQRRVDKLLMEKENLVTELSESKRELVQLRKQLAEAPTDSSSTVGSSTPSENGAHTLRIYDPNHPTALKKKIADLESQLQDQMEAYQSLLQEDSHRSADDKQLKDLRVQNQLLRDEADRWKRKSEDTAVQRNWVKELDELKDDLFELKNKNDKLAAENQRLRDNLNYQQVNSGKSSTSTYDTALTSSYQQERTRVMEEVHRLRRELKSASSSRPAAAPAFTMTGLNGSAAKSRSMANISAAYDAPIPREHASPYEEAKSLYRSSAWSQVSDNTSVLALDPNPRNHYTSRRGMSQHEDDADTSSLISHVNREFHHPQQVHLHHMTLAATSLDNGHAGRSYSGGPIRPSAHSRPYFTDHHGGPFPSTTTTMSRVHLDGLRQMEKNSFSTVGRHPFAPRSANDIDIGDIVKFSRHGGRISKGVVHFIGSLPGRHDTYLGVELDLEDGKHDGVYEGRRYFQCKHNKGVFVAFNKIIMCYGFGEQN